MVRVVHSAAVAGVSIVIAACSGTFDLFLDLDPATTTVLVARVEPQRVAIEVVDRRDRPVFPGRFERGDGPFDLVVLQYAEPPSRLRVAEGPLPLTVDQSGDLLPGPLRIDQATVDRGAPSWTRTDTLPEGLALIRYAPLGFEACLSNGGCPRRLEEDGEVICEEPCPAPTPITPPAAPMPPIAICPDGWTTVPPEDEHDSATCSPFPAGWIACEEGTFLVPGADTCRRIGRTCPAAPFSPERPSGRTLVFVDASEPAGGSGTETSPFSTIAEATAVATADSVILLARGTYPESVMLPAGVTLEGACVEETVIDPPAGAAGILVTTSSATVRELTVRGSTAFDLRSSDVTVESVSVRPTGVWGFRVDSGRLTATAVRIVETSRPVDVTSGADVTLDRVAIEAPSTYGILAFGQGTVVTATDLAIVDPTLRAVSADGGASFTLERGWMSGPRGDGLVIAGGRDSYASLTDVVLENGLGNATGGVIVFASAEGAAQRVWVENVKSRAFAALSGTLTVTDAVVRQVDGPSSVTNSGSGFVTADGGILNVERAVVSMTEGFGSLAIDDGTRVSLVDVRMGEIRSRGNFFGSGLVAEQRAFTRVERVEIARARGTGLFVDFEGEVEGCDLNIHDILERDESRAFGRCAEIEAAGSLVASRVVLERCHGAAAYVLDAGTLLDLTDARIAGTTRSERCTNAGGCNTTIADGLTITLSAAVRLHRFEILDNDEAGIRSASSGLLQLRDGRVAGNAIGYEWSSPTFDLGAAADGVVVENNVRNFVDLSQ